MKIVSKELTKINGKNFRYEFTFKELMYFLFHEKVYPKCNGKMNKEKVCETIINESSNVLGQSRMESNNYFYRFTCKNCNSEYTLTELAER